MSNATAASEPRITVGFVAAGIGARRHDPKRHALRPDGRFLCGQWADPVAVVKSEARAITVSCKTCARRLAASEGR